MPWFPSNPTQADLDFWFFVPQLSRVSTYPRPETNRVDCRVRFSRQVPPFENVLTRYLVRIVHSNPPERVGGLPDRERWGWFDFEVEQTDEMSMSTGNDVDGFNMSAVMQSAQSMSDSGLEGVEIFTQGQFAVPGELFSHWQEWGINSVRPFRWNVDTEAWPPDYFREVHSGEFPWWDNIVTYWGFADCYEFPTAPGGPGFARFNGVDAYIQLNANTQVISGRWQVKCDLFVRQRLQFPILCDDSQQVLFCGFNATNTFWRNQGGVMSPPFPLNQWFTFRMERDWFITANPPFRAFVDDVQIAAWSGANFGQFFRRLGGNRPGLGQYGDFDMRDLTISEGSPAGPLVRLDMPLRDDACDQGPDMLKGTTFNMPLPSCP